LIQISGAKAKNRDFVYFTDVKNIPSTDLATIERLWIQFSKGKFGYSVQKVRSFFSSPSVELSLSRKGSAHSIFRHVFSIHRKNGSNLRVILKSFVERLVGRRQMETSNGRSDGLGHPNLFMM